MLTEIANSFSDVTPFEYRYFIIFFWIFVLVITILMLFLCYLYLAKRRSLEREYESLIFSHAFLLAQEKERERISRELHDTIAQDLRCLSLGMEKISRTENPVEREKLCDEAVASQSGLIRRVREICDHLIPPDFHFLDLGDAIMRLCLDFGKRSGIDCRTEIMEDPLLRLLSKEQQLQVFRIVQEALTNVEKHAEATEAIVLMRNGAEGIYIGISDDGKGFALTKETSGSYSWAYQFSASEPGRLGIWSMNKRAEILGGSLAIKSERGEGTLVCLEIPLKLIESKDLDNASNVN